MTRWRSTPQVNRAPLPKLAVVCAAFLLAGPAALGAAPGDAARGGEAPAQADPSAPPDAAGKSDARRKRSRSQGDHTQDVGFLLGALKAAPDASSAKAIENRILALWLVSGSDTADLLMARVKTATDAKDLDLAIQLLDAVVELRPEYAEGWNRRATLYFMKKDYGRSLADLRQTLAREPRHFGAWAGLGMILQEIGEEKPSLDAFRRALELNPHLPRLSEAVKALTEKVEGRDI